MCVCVCFITVVITAKQNKKVKQLHDSKKKYLLKVKHNIKSAISMQPVKLVTLFTMQSTIKNIPLAATLPITKWGKEKKVRGYSHLLSVVCFKQTQVSPLVQIFWTNTNTSD